jgi:putative phosphoesterase
MKIGIISDTHSYIDNEIMDYFRPVDEIWHAGDIGDMKIVKTLKAFKPLVAVHGNIDDFRLRSLFPEDQVLMREGIKIFITHIGGYPGRYERGVKKKLQIARPGLFVCGHSHILKVMSDKTIGNMLCINPGAAGHAGFHVMRTIIRMDIQAGEIKDLEVIELGKRGKMKPASNKAGL